MVKPVILSGEPVDGDSWINILTLVTNGSFSDFEDFLSQKEFTTENLLFIVCFSSYAERFFALSEEERACVVPPSTKLVDRSNPFGYFIAHDGQDRADGNVNLEEIIPKISNQRHFKVCEWTQEGGNICLCGNPLHEAGHYPLETPILPHSTRNQSQTLPSDMSPFAEGWQSRSQY
jgi:hypothetical protein